MTLDEKTGQPKGKVVVNFQDIFERGDAKEDIVLRKNDVILVPEKRDFINLIGQVVQPGKIPFDKNMKVRDYITLAGGFGWRAVESDVRVVRANSGEWVDEDDVKELYPGDIISTGTPSGVGPMKPGDRVEIRIEQVGQLINTVIQGD